MALVLQAMVMASLKVLASPGCRAWVNIHLPQKAQHTHFDTEALLAEQKPCLPITWEEGRGLGVSAQTAPEGSLAAADLQVF